MKQRRISRIRTDAIADVKSILSQENITLSEEVIFDLVNAVLDSTKTKQGSAVADRLATMMIPGKRYRTKELAVMVGASYVVANQAVHRLCERGLAVTESTAEVGSGRWIILK